jgi:FkbM family methyltransferase
MRPIGTKGSQIFVISLFYKIIRRIIPIQFSFSQSGEDIIVLRLLSKLRVKRPSYLDIGANDPVRLNNTFLLYVNGARGVLVEPHPLLFKSLCRKRKHDKILNIGVGTTDQKSVDFFVMSNEFLHTFNRHEALQLSGSGNAMVEKVMQIQLLSINKILEEHFLRCPNFISLDAEGMDEDILRALNFSKYRPEVLCVECVDSSHHGEGTTNIGINRLMDQKGYMAYASTHINTIFVDKEKWLNRNEDSHQSP